MNKTRVLVVDDSALVRKLLLEIINSQSDMVCIGTANDPLIAREMIREMDPDVLTLDVEMPKMDGIEFLSRLMRLRPMPVVMISTLTERGAEVTMRALELGAVDFVAKPRMGLTDGIKDLSAQIVDKIRVAAVAKVTRAAPAGVAVGALKSSLPGVAASPLGRISTEKIICIGASTGGTEAIREVLTRMPADSPAIVITQHMPPGFTTSFAARLDTLCQIHVKEAVQGERILPGHAYIAPGGKQFRLSRSGANYVAVVEDSEPVNRHRPSVEVLFKSAAAIAGRNAFGIMLTGMGNDGAQAMREMKDAGSYNFVQDEASCIVFGMPREAILHGAADEVLPLTGIAPALLGRLRGVTDRYRV
ncbi:MAG TPA: chemotaxis response regulator protein-glutamate methylesterase [Burkholderiaceae bacterium]|nr:chemotaxis response regulator protein-glutamate methylesterase [Rhodoferax sp.]HNW00780.1 chemotaxis response regulator protein-glutamate methylesterase [Burkholderiaceae bacterium]MBP6492754.1 chemotaxis response regulator protein-glutamate methylesterase [Rhodoferax sp.]MBP7573070.1 chemotaxis response regulator protein-glutamate methylesterase [Rhodoferax sp.]MBP8134915.1 chemotaxis response regulator protein-glutamate methylesterase [Rhodoferax sp.]